MFSAPLNVPSISTQMVYRSTVFIGSLYYIVGSFFMVVVCTPLKFIVVKVFYHSPKI